MNSKTTSDSMDSLIISLHLPYSSCEQGLEKGPRGSLTSSAKPKGTLRKARADVSWSARVIPVDLCGGTTANFNTDCHHHETPLSYPCSTDVPYPSPRSQSTPYMPPNHDVSLLSLPRSRSNWLRQPLSTETERRLRKPGLLFDSNTH